jgi:acyl-coenzyme A thioesterase PaaI-like protein
LLSYKLTFVVNLYQGSTEGRRQKADCRLQRAEGRLQVAEGRGQKAEGRRQIAEGRLQRADSRRQVAGGRLQIINNIYFVFNIFCIFLQVLFVKLK